jgi:transcriptional regulator with XRE-family HTH domain
MTLNRPPAGAKRSAGSSSGAVDVDAEFREPPTGSAAVGSSGPTSALDAAEQVITERARALGEFIREQRRVARLSLRKLSDMAEISNPYLSQIERGLRKPSAEILQQLARALRISAETLYVQAGILDERHENADLAKAIWDDATLSESQKRALIQVMRSFQAENRAASEAAAASANK